MKEVRKWLVPTYDVDGNSVNEAVETSKETLMRHRPHEHFRILSASAFRMHGDCNEEDTFLAFPVPFVISTSDPFRHAIRANGEDTTIVPSYTGFHIHMLKFDFVNLSNLPSVFYSRLTLEMFSFLTTIVLKYFKS